MDQKIIATIKALGMDMIAEAKSGHPGIVLGAAPTLYTLYSRHLNVSTKDPNWINRDRFVMSAGHGSALLYAVLHLAGFSLTLEDLKQFRRIGSKTPGHPEYGVTPGVDMSTGPLGQGIASAVGMAIAEKMLEEKTKLPKEGKWGKDHSLIQYHVYALCGDGDLMEGISYEAASLAGSLKLNNLIVLYDSNQVSLDGATSMTFEEDVRGRFSALGWNTIYVKDGNNVKEIDRAIIKAKESALPTLIEIRTIIGDGSLLAGKNTVHGKVLEKEDLQQLKVKLGVSEVPFTVREEVKSSFAGQVFEHSDKKYTLWSKEYQTYLDQENSSGIGHCSFWHSDEPISLFNHDFQLETEKREATRVTNGKIMNELVKMVPNLVGGSADLSSSVKSYLEDAGDFSASNRYGKNIWYGVREHAMGAISNGLALSHFRPFASTFLVFSDYLKPAMRLSALMNLPVTYIFSHDAVNVGEDGPTHEPVEQLSMLRTIPNMTVYRPADGHELIGSWNTILNKKSPACLILSRVEVPLISTTRADQVNRGGYPVLEQEGPLHGVLIATGSEVATAIYIAIDLYREKGLNLRVVSMPSRELFLAEAKEYQEQVLPTGVRKVVLEAGSTDGWHQFVYHPRYLITIDQFGASGTKEEVLKYCQFDYETIKERILKLFL